MPGRLSAAVGVAARELGEVALRKARDMGQQLREAIAALGPSTAA
jgi:hypothetical protein